MSKQNIDRVDIAVTGAKIENGNLSSISFTESDELGVIGIRIVCSKPVHAEYWGEDELLAIAIELHLGAKDIADASTRADIKAAKVGMDEYTKNIDDHRAERNNATMAAFLAGNLHPLENETMAIQWVEEQLDGNIMTLGSMNTIYQFSHPLPDLVRQSICAESMRLFVVENLHFKKKIDKKITKLHAKETEAMIASMDRFDRGSL